MGFQNFVVSNKIHPFLKQKKNNLLIIFLLLLLKPAAQAKVEKTTLFTSILSQPHKHLHHGKLNKTQLVEATNG